MKRFAKALLFLVALTGFSCLQSSIASAATNVNAFTIEDYQIDYYLERAPNAHSTLKTIESISALFPQSDQNHGIERAIPSTYEGHSTQLQIDSVVDQNNQAYNFTTYDVNNNTVVRIGDAGSYVHGLKTYTLTYSQRDITSYFSNTNRDEFYWDTNGNDWQVPIRSLTARLHLADTISSATTGNTACYFGSPGATDPCTLSQNSNTYTVAVTDVAPTQNATIAVGFKPHTFAMYSQSLAQRLVNIAILISILSIPVAIILVIWFAVRYQRRSNRTSELSTIIPEYIPPANTSVSTAAAISHKSGRNFSAQLIDFAVRHYIRIYETRQKSLFRSAQYELEITKDISKLLPEEQELLQDIFESIQVGAKLDMSTLKKNRSLAIRLQDNPGKLSKLIAGTYGLRNRDDRQSRWFKRAGFMTLIAAVVTVSPALLIAAIVSFGCGMALKPLTDKGLALARYLKGLEMYIKVAETDRLRMLQSPEGAAKIGAPVDTNDSRQLIKLYERVLPYAILLGQENEWNKRLGDYYQSANESPSWYSGQSPVFNAAVFATAMNNFNSTATYSNPSSSSSGGSGGGGFSGGGGGGGGGGGW